MTDASVTSLSADRDSDVILSVRRDCFMFANVSQLCSRRTPFVLLSRNSLSNRLLCKPCSLPIFHKAPTQKLLFRPYSQFPPTPAQPQKPKDDATPAKTTRENIYTIPNLLTISRILACPVLGWSIVEGNFVLASSLLLYAGLTDFVRMFLDLLCSALWGAKPALF